MPIGKCKHGEFELMEGCPTCIAERRQAGIKPEQDEMEEGLNSEGLTLANSLVKVQYYRGDEPMGRDYTYFSEDCLAVGDIVMVPVRDTTGKAVVSSIDVPDSEIEAFRDKVKVIPAGSVVVQFEREATYCKGQESIEPVDYSHPAFSPDPNAWRTGEEEVRTEPETAVALRPGEDIEARNHYEEALRLLEYAEKRVIASLEDNKAASDDLTIISRLKKQMEVKKREYLDPLRVQAEAIRETYSTLMDPILAAEKLTKDKMLAYDSEQRRIRAAQEEINRKRIEAAQEEMKLKGELSESVNLVEVVPEAPKTIKTFMGTSGTKENWKWEVIDFALVPDTYKMINPAILTPTAKSYKDTRTIPGIRIYNDPIIATRAR